MKHLVIRLSVILIVSILILWMILVKQNPPLDKANARVPQNDEELSYWLNNMLQHQYSLDEMEAAIGIDSKSIQDTQQRLSIQKELNKQSSSTNTLQILAYPGGRHPRKGFYDGAIRPQRESKISIFSPWDAQSYAVLDIPEAIWSNLGLLYLAHTHVDTIWTKENIQLQQLEWKQLSPHHFHIERTLPNQVRFGANVHALKHSVAIEMWLHNGSSKKLSDLRLQNCLMLGYMKGFDSHSQSNKIRSDSVVACQNKKKQAWILNQWQPHGKAWDNPDVPCMHVNPRFDDCEPGQTQKVYGRVVFYKGKDIQSKMTELKKENLEQWFFNQTQ